MKLAGVQAVVVVGRTESDLRQVCAEIAAMGGTAVACVGDVANPLNLRLRTPNVLRAQGWTPRHLVCNAGIGKSGATEALESSAWTRVFEVNVHGCFHMVCVCRPELILLGGWGYHDNQQSGRRARGCLRCGL